MAIVWSADHEAIALAASKGELRCDTCGLPVTLSNPLEPGRLVWLEVDRWVEDGTPKARCRTHGVPC